MRNSYNSTAKLQATQLNMDKIYKQTFIKYYMVYKQTQEFSNNEPLVKSRGIISTEIDKLTSTNTDDVDSLALFTQR